MTGLDLEVDELVEIAVIITDYDLTPVDAGLSIVIKPERARSSTWASSCATMHTESGLIDEIPNGVSLADAEYQVLEYMLKHVPAEQKAPLAGNTIGTDRAFLAKYMPRLDAHLHYRNVDVSSIKELAKRWFPRAYFNAPAKNGGHRALADILESIRELHYYRRAVFVAEPGPSSQELQTLAASVVDEFAPKV